MNHERGWEGAAPESNAGYGDWFDCPHVGAASESFFFSFLFFFSRIRTDMALFTPNQADSARIKSHRLNQVISADDRNSQKGLKSALNHAGTAEIGFEWGPNILNWSFLNFIMNICCFFCVFFFVLCFVLCFLSTSFFVLWIKA